MHATSFILEYVLKQSDTAPEKYKAFPFKMRILDAKLCLCPNINVPDCMWVKNE